MIRYYPSIWFGTLDEEAIRVVCIVPKREKGVVVKSLDLFLSTQQEPGTSDYWSFDLGTVVGQMEFVSRFPYADPKRGYPKGRNPVFFGRVVAYDPGEVMAVRALPVGAPADLVELQVVVGMEEP